MLVGRNGLGKTMIARNICHTAVLAGHSVLFRSAAALLEDLHRQTPEGRRSKLRTYVNVDLLCVNEVGYRSSDDKAVDLLYEVVNRRYERKPVILTTNRPFKEWNEVFPNATCIVTLLDRLLNHAEVTVIEGDSYRVRESEQETAARRTKKWMALTPRMRSMWWPCSCCTRTCRTRRCGPARWISRLLASSIRKRFPWRWSRPPYCSPRCDA